MRLPDTLYEVVPAVYAVVGLTSMLRLEPGLGRLSGALLVSAALLILYMRATHRKGDWS